MDLLSEFLQSVRLSGALFYNGEFSSPWCFRSPPSSCLSASLGGQGDVVIFHFLLDGGAWVRLDKGGDPIAVRAGEVVIFPHGDAHLMGHGPPTEPVDNGAQIERILAQQPGSIARMGGGGELTHIVCGYLVCEPHLGRLLFSGLPRVLAVPIRGVSSGQWIEGSIRFALAQAGPGARAVLTKLAEAVFMETLRCSLVRMPPGQTGWLAGVRDPILGRALTLLHRDPARPWTLAKLATASGVSRDVLAERFRRFLGDSAMAYLTRWRLHLAARLLASTAQNVGEIAPQAGYASEAAFNRAFKRAYGSPPADYRRRIAT